MSDTNSNEQAKVIQLEKNYAVMDVKVDRLTQDISEIKNNHLLHINDSLGKLSQTVATNQATLLEKISGLQITDAKVEPSNKLFDKIIEYVILGIVGVGIAFFASK
jgi:hypothetical protein